MENTNNPFQHLKGEFEAAEVQRSETKRRDDLLQQQKHQAMRAAEQHYGQMVMQVLEQLKEAVYPSSFSVQKSESFPSHWQIGFLQWLVDGNGNQYSSWQAVAGVSLGYNEQNNSVVYDCWRKGKAAVRSGLSQTELVAALLRLYSH